MARHVWFAICIAIYLPGIWSKQSQDWRLMNIKFNLLKSNFDNEIPRLKLEILDLRTELDLERARTDDATNDATELHKQLKAQSVRIHELERSVDNLQQANAVEDNSKTAVKVLENFAKSIKQGFKSEKLRLRNITDKLNLKSNEVQQDTVRDMNKTIHAIIGQVKELANSTRAKLTDLQLAVDADKLRPCCLSDSARCNLKIMAGSNYWTEPSAGEYHPLTRDMRIDSGTTMYINCMDGYDLLRVPEQFNIGNMTTSVGCLQGNWTRIFRCERQRCSRERPDNVVVSRDGTILAPGDSVFVNDQVTVQCAAGFEPVDADHLREYTATCNPDRTWSPPFPDCREKRCSRERPDNVVVSRDGTILAPGDSVFVNDQVTVQCAAGFEPVDADHLREYTATCNPDRTWSPPFPDCRESVHDCRDIYESGYHTTGVYNVSVNVSGQLQTLQVYCDMDTPGGGWTVFQRRFDGSVDFYRNFAEYESGFGVIKGEFWLGLKWVYWMTVNRASQMMINMTEAASGRELYVKYGTFSLGPATGYRLHATSPAGTADRRGVSSVNGRDFTTYDHDVDQWNYENCAIHRHAGFWFNACAYVNLNGHYGGNYPGHRYSGFFWYYAEQFLRTSQMAFRRVS